MKSRIWVAVASIVSIVALFTAISATAGEKEEKMSLDKVPAAVKAAIEKATISGKIKEIVKKQHDGKAIYDVDYVKDGNKIEMAVAEDGTIVKTEEKTSIKKVPAVVKAAIEKATNGGKVKKIKKEQHGEKVVYDVDYVKDGKKMEMEVAEDGTIVKTEEKTNIKKVPAVVKAAIEKATIGGKVKKIEKEQHDGKVIYSVDYVIGGEKKDIKVDEDGKVVASDKKGGDK